MSKFLIWLAGGCGNLVETVNALRSAGNEVGVLLVQDGVFSADRGCPHSKALRNLGVKFYVSKKHLEERGLSGRLALDVKVLEYPEIADLIMEKYDRVITI